MVKMASAIALIASICAIAACGSNSDKKTSVSGSGTTTTDKAAGKKLALLLSAQNGYILSIVQGAKEAAAKRGDSVTFLTADGDPQKQLNQLQDVVTSKQYDGVLIDPISPQMEQPVLNAIKAGIPVGLVGDTLDADVLRARSPPGIAVTAGSGAPRVVDGLTELINDACGSKPCKVGYIMGSKSFPLETILVNAIKQRVSSNPNVKFVATGEGQYQAGPARAAAADMLSAHPDINVIATNSDTMAQGAALAVKAAGKTNIKIVGVGAGKVGCAAVKDGTFFGTVNLIPRTLGAAAVDGLLATLADPTKVNQVIDVGKQSGLPLITTAGAAGQCPAQWTD